MWIIATFIFLIGFVSTQSGFAQDLLSAAAQPSRQEQFEGVKSEVSNLIEDNKKLEVEYSLLKNEFDNLINQLTERKKEVEDLKNKFGYQDDSLEKAAAAPKPADSSADEALTLESKINYLKTRLGNLEDQNLARKLQIDALRQQKGETEIDIKMMNYKLADKNNTNELDKLKVEIDNMQKEEEKAVNQIAELEEKKQIYPKKIEELRATNKELQNKVIELEKKNDFKSRENANLRDKKLLEQMLAERAYSVHQEEKIKLEQSLSQLQKQYTMLDQQVSSSLQLNNQNREMLKSLIQVDKENQDLRDRIVALKEKLSQINQ